MNEEKKERAMEQFIEDGYYTHAASDVIDINRKTTELEHDTERISHEECVWRVDLSHYQINKKYLRVC